MTSAETTDPTGMDLEHARHGLWAAAIAVERAARETIGTRQEAMIGLARTLHEAIGQLAALAPVG
jgi:hypothetical protein